MARAPFLNGVGLGLPSVMSGPLNVLANGTAVTLQAGSVSGQPAVLAGGNSGITAFTGNSPLGLAVYGSTSTNDYTGIDLGTGPTNPKARIAAVFSGSGSTLNFGTSNNYTTGITNTALSINPSGAITIATPAAGNSLTISQINGNYGLSTSAASLAQIGINGGGGTLGTTSFDLSQDNSSIGYVLNRANASLILGTNNSSRLSIAAGGAVTIATPSSGVALTVNGISGNNAISCSDGTANVVLQLNGAGTSVVGTNSNTAFGVQTNGATRLSISTNGSVTISAPTSAGTALTVTGYAGASGNVLSLVGQGTSGDTVLGISGQSSTGLSLSITGNAAGTQAIALNTQVTTGANTATFTATNKPGLNSNAPSKWLPIQCDGSKYWIPLWAN